MIYNYGLPNKIYLELLKDLPQGSIRNMNDYNKLQKLVTNNDFVIIFNWGKGARKLQKEFQEKGVKVFPKPEVSLLLAEKITQLKLIDQITMFPIERRFVENQTYDVFSVPVLKNSHKVVVKIGNEHQGLNKFLMNPYDKIRAKENIIFEEFIKEARSIRIALFSDKPNDIYIIEQVNSRYALENYDTTWIKNINPEEFIYSYEERHKLNIPNIDQIIEDAKNITKYLNHYYIGIDYVVNEKKTGFLEVNDMIGLPDDERLFKTASNFLKQVLRGYLKL